MPELLEVELYRRSLSALVGHTVTRVTPVDPWWCRDAPDLSDLVVGRRLAAARRHGKVLLLDTDGPTVGLRFGMTGRLVVGGASAVTELVYGAHGDDPAWNRVEIVVGAVPVVVSDPRRLGRIDLDPDVSVLGPDVWGIAAEVLRERLVGSATAIKNALLDQHRVAGLGNMLADEVLLRAGVAPTRRCCDVEDDEWQSLANAAATALPEMLAAGGSHAGVLSAELRRDGAPCPIDGASMQRTVLGGRSAIHCPVHQR